MLINVYFRTVTTSLVNKLKRYKIKKNTNLYVIQILLNQLKKVT